MAKLSDLVAKAARQPYELELDDGTTVSVPQPTIPQWRQACQADSLDGFLQALGVSAEHAAAVQAQMEGAPFGAESAVIRALRTYYQLGN